MTLTGTLALFVALMTMAAFLHHVVTQESFRISWRWIHDTTILPSNLFLAPSVGLLLLVHVVARGVGGDVLDAVPRWGRHGVFLVVNLFLANSLSQACGGCVWFVFTEGWWVRFGSGWLLPGGEVAPEGLVAGVYGAFAVLTTFLSLWFYRRYLWKP